MDDYFVLSVLYLNTHIQTNILTLSYKHARSHSQIYILGLSLSPPFFGYKGVNENIADKSPIVYGNITSSVRSKYSYS